MPEAPDFEASLVHVVLERARRAAASVWHHQGDLIEPADRNRRPIVKAGRCVLRFVCASVLAASLLQLMLGPARATLLEHRIALVIGNNQYIHLDSDRQLVKAVNDANAVGDALERDGFQVLRGVNLTRSQIVDKLYELSAMIQPGDTALFYFAGHGVALGSGNYLLPSDVPDIELGQEQRLAGQSVAEADVIATLQDKGARVTVMILDACRDNPFKKPGLRSIGLDRGFGRGPEANGVFSLYSAGYGQSALDRLSYSDQNPNSVFTRVLIPLLTRPGLNLDDLAYNVREQVAQLAATTPDHHMQIPAAYDQIIGGRVYLGGAEGDDAALKTAPAQKVRPTSPPSEAPTSPSVTTPPSSPSAPAVAARVATIDTSADNRAISDPIVGRELRDRLFDQGFDPGEPGSSELTTAIRDFEKRAGLPQSGLPTSQLLDNLRTLQPPSPWGAIAFGPHVQRFGMAWSLPTRRAALAQAQARCAAGDCNQIVSFAGNSCGALAVSSRAYFISWHDDKSRARADALSKCDARGETCRVVGAVCADGSGRVSMLRPEGHQP